MTIISKSTQGVKQKTAVGNNSYLLFFSCPQPGPTRKYEKKSDFVESMCFRCHETKHTREEKKG